MPTLGEQLRAFLEEDLAVRKDRVALIEQGKVSFHSQRMGEPMVDTTQATLEADKAAIVRIDEQLERMGRP